MTAMTPIRPTPRRSSCGRAAGPRCSAKDPRGRPCRSHVIDRDSLTEGLDEAVPPLLQTPATPSWQPTRASQPTGASARRSATTVPTFPMVCPTAQPTAVVPPR